MDILLLEDDVILNELIEEYLSEQGYNVDISFDGYEAQDKIYSKKYDILILDVNVPNIDGFELLKTLRDDGYRMPAIFITSLNTSKDMEDGFSSGADDYIKKPFELEELILRINNIKRLYNIDDSSLIDISLDIKFDFATNNIRKDNDTIQISKKESKILKYFLNNTNRIISVEELCVNIWSYDHTPSDSTIRTYIKNIRKNIGESYITNLKGLGYRFNKI